jgi:hypothetical protein
MPGMSGGIEFVFTHGDLAVARFERVVITLIREDPTFPFLDAAQDLGRKLFRLYGPNGVGSLTLIPGQVPIPDAKFRERAKVYTKESAAWLCAGATVVGGEGFAASVIRSVVSAITLFEAGPPRRVFSSVDGASEWLAIRTGTPPARYTPLIEWCKVAMSAEYRTALAS